MMFVMICCLLWNWKICPFVGQCSLLHRGRGT